MRNRLSAKIVFFPIYFLLGFLVFSEVLYFIGPIDYAAKGKLLLFVYLVLLNLALFKGYEHGVVVKFKERKRNRIRVSKRVRFFPLQMVRFIILAAIIVYVLRYIFELHIYSPSSFVNKILFAVLNSGDVYKDKLDASSPTMITYVFMVLSPIPFLAQTLGLCYWKRLTRTFKWLLVLIFFLEICSWLASGTRKGILDVLLIIGAMLLVLDPEVLVDKKKLRKFRIAILSGAGVFVLYFVISNLSRYGIAASDYSSFNLDSVRPFYQKCFPLAFNLVLTNLAGYLCQGYYALSLALNDFFSQGVFCFTYGMGSSWFDINVSENLFHIDPLPYTYQGYLATRYGIDEMVQWHTLYLWLANDFTFFGTPLVIYGFGYLTSNAWCDALSHRNKYAAPMFALCVLMIVYAFANNQVLSFNFVPFFCVLFLYLAHNPKFGMLKKKKIERPALYSTEGNEGSCCSTQ